MSYTVNARVIFNNGEGVDAADFNAATNKVSFNDFFIEPGLNTSPENHGYSHSDNTFIWSEGVQCLARPGAAANTVTNSAGRIYFTTAGTPSPTGTTPLVYAIDLAEDCLLTTLTPDGTHPRYATIGLTISSNTTNASRDFLDDATRAITSISTPKYQTFTVTVNVTLGTPAISPTVPSFSGTPWAIVRIPTSNASPFSTGIVQACAYPRGYNKYQVSAFGGYSNLGGPLNANVVAWGSIALGVVQSKGSWNVASTAANAGGSDPDDFLDVTLSVPLQSTNHFGVWASSIDTSTGYHVQARVRTTVGGAGTNGKITFQAVNFSGGNVKLHGASGNPFVFQVVDMANGFFASTYDDSGNYLITSAGSPPDGWEWTIPIPVISPDKKLTKIVINGSNVSGRFKLVTNNGLPAIILSASDLNSVLSGSTFDLTQLTAPVWCNGGSGTPFSTITGTFGLVWTPQFAGETLTSVEFVIAG